MSAATRERKLKGWASAVKGVLASDEGAVWQAAVVAANSVVMPGLDPGIHDFLSGIKTWMAGPSPAMTKGDYDPASIAPAAPAPPASPSACRPRACRWERDAPLRPLRRGVDAAAAEARLRAGASVRRRLASLRLSSVGRATARIADAALAPGFFRLRRLAVNRSPAAGCDGATRLAPRACRH